MSDMTALQIAGLCAAGFIYGIAKTGIIGLGVLTTPLLLYLFSPTSAIGLALPVLLLADAIAVLLFRRAMNWRIFLRAEPAAIAGIAIGYRVLAYTMDFPDGEGDVFLRQLIAGFMLVVLAAGIAFRFAVGGKPGAEANAEFPPERTACGDGSDIHIPILSRRYVFIAGICLIGGFSTMISNYSGPAWVVYLMNYRLDKKHFIGTAAWIFFFLNLTKLPFAVHLGLVSLGSLTSNAFMLPFLVFGLLCGRLITNRISQTFFDNLTQAIALLGVLYLLAS